MKSKDLIDTITNDRPAWTVVHVGDPDNKEDPHRHEVHLVNEFVKAPHRLRVTITPTTAVFRFVHDDEFQITGSRLADCLDSCERHLRGQRRESANTAD